LLVAAPRFLPERQTITSMTSRDRSRRMREYVTELEIQEGGGLAGQPFAKTALSQVGGFRVLQIIRGEEILWPPFNDLVLAKGDALVISGKIQHVVDIQKKEGLVGLDQALEGDLEWTSKEMEFAELLVLPNSVYVGKTLEEAQFRQHFRIAVLAIQRHGMHLRRKLSQHPLRVGDTLLVQGGAPDLEKLGSEEGLVLMSGVEDVLIRRGKAPIAVGILTCVVLLLSLPQIFSWERIQIATVALAGAAAMVFSGCLPAGKVYEAVHWRVLVMIAGTLALGTAMHTTGTAEWIASGLLDLFKGGGPHLMVLVTLIFCALLSECITNSAVAILMIPVALEIPVLMQESGAEVSALPFIMAVAYGASCSFLTPIGYQTNALVYGAGGYRFGDFIRLGGPLVVVVWILGGLLIPVFWPL
ncbi:MAG: SLC13 family permease, partial [Planctomycetota bacterium]